MEEKTESLEQLLKDIFEQTGVCAYLSPRGGEETEFTAEWNDGTVCLYLAGSGESAAREAKLIAYLLRETPSPAQEGGRPRQLMSILLGEGGKVQAFRYLAKHRLADGPCFALEVIPDRRERDAFEHIERCLDGRDRAALTGEGRIAVVKFIEEGQSPFEFAQFLEQSLYEEAGIHVRIGVGCETSSFSVIAGSYFQAVSAIRMSEMLGDRGSVHSYREYLLIRMLSDLPKERLREYLSQLSAGETEEAYGDEELIGTAEAFLEGNLNLSETSRALFIHRNTLSYRLDKIERLTGLNIRKFSDAVTFRVISVLLRLVRE